MQDAGLGVVGEKKKNRNAAQLLRLKVLVSSVLAGVQVALYATWPRSAACHSPSSQRGLQRCLYCGPS